MIVAVKNEDRVIVGVSICEGSADMTPKDLALEDNFPFWKVKGEKECYVGAEEMSYSVDLLRYHPEVFKGVTDGESVVESVLPKMKKLLGKNERLIDGKEWYNGMLIIKGDRIFHISNYLCVSEAEEYIAEGFDSYMEGALEATRDMEPADRVLEAFRHTARMRNRMLFPVMLFDSKSKRKKVYYE